MKVVVDVAGEVARPGICRLPATARAADAVHAAGGPTRAADLVAVNLAAPLQDGAEIIVSAKGAVPRDDSSRDTLRSDLARSPRHSHRRRRKHRLKSARGPASESSQSASQTDAAAIDLNAADATLLETLPGVGPALAQRIVAFRDVNGPFASLDELLDVGGMTQTKVDALAPLLTLR